MITIQMRLFGVGGNAPSPAPISSEAISLQIAQRLSVTLHRENARAIMKRMTEPADAMNENSHSGWASHSDELDD